MIFVLSYLREVNNMNTRIRKVRTDSGLKQDAFAKKLGLTKNFISLVETGGREPSDRTISDICREFNINENWLRTGEGDMRSPQTRNQEIMAFANRVMTDEDESFRKRFVTALGNASPEFWDELEKFLDALKKD